MIYLYDNAIVDDLQRSFNPQNVPNPLVKVIAPEAAIMLAAQLQNDEVQLPVVALFRHSNLQLDSTRANFTRIHHGVVAVIDKETNNLYYEKAIPIELGYDLTILTHNTADMDEIVKEILFKYTNMYFLSIDLPYECDRKVRFGVTIAPDTEIERESSTAEYYQNGQLYQTRLQLKCEGCVLVSYTPQKLKHYSEEITAVDPTIKKTFNKY